MPLSQISNGDSGLSARNAINAAIARVNSFETPASLAYNATLSPAYGDGALRTVTMTGNATLNVPSGASAGQIWTGIFIASGGARDLNLASGFKTLTGATYTPTITSSSIRFIQAYYTGSVWLVIKNQEFAP